MPIPSIIRSSTNTDSKEEILLTGNQKSKAASSSTDSLEPVFSFTSSGESKPKPSATAQYYNMCAKSPNPIFTRAYTNISNERLFSAPKQMPLLPASFPSGFKDLSQKYEKEKKGGFSSIMNSIKDLLPPQKLSPAKPLSQTMFQVKDPQQEPPNVPLEPHEYDHLLRCMEALGMWDERGISSLFFLDDVDDSDLVGENRQKEALQLIKDRTTGIKFEEVDSKLVVRKDLYKFSDGSLNYYSYFKDSALAAIQNRFSDRLISRHQMTDTFSTDKFICSVARFVRLSGPYQHLFLWLRSIACWDKPRESMFWCLLYFFLVFSGFIGVAILALPALIMAYHRIRPTHAAKTMGFDKLDSGIINSRLVHVASQGFLGKTKLGQAFWKAWRKELGTPSHIIVADTADLMERAKNCFNWVDPRASRRAMYISFILGFLYFLTPHYFRERLIFTAIGIEFFILAPFQLRYTQFRRLLWVSEWVLWQCPTDLEHAITVLRANNPKCASAAHFITNEESDPPVTIGTLDQDRIQRNVLTYTDSMHSLKTREEGELLIEPGPLLRPTSRARRSIEIMASPVHMCSSAPPGMASQEMMTSDSEDSQHIKEPISPSKNIGGPTTEKTSKRIKRKAERIKNRITSMLSGKNQHQDQKSADNNETSESSEAKSSFDQTVRSAPAGMSDQYLLPAENNLLAVNSSAYDLNIPRFSEPPPPTAAPAGTNTTNSIDLNYYEGFSNSSQDLIADKPRKSVFSKISKVANRHRRNRSNSSSNMSEDSSSVMSVAPSELDTLSMSIAPSIDLYRSGTLMSVCGINPLQENFPISVFRCRHNKLPGKLIMGCDMFAFRRTKTSGNQILVGPIPYDSVIAFRKFSLLKWNGLAVQLFGGDECRFYFGKQYDEAYACFVSRCIQA
ncbi:hypothetical protein H4219_003880 [Mycoemilia scoparia]|uniref:Uncharacterized protein n=1 Tax=Mycoemilia scoparia TaxID=417184 RepID=A0A9W8DSQ8_9FUNG|nr:hypothetical protein H4219_003880 [Mycoemilia scoparia]